MIVRILGEGQWNVPDDAVRDLNALDEAVEQAVESDDAAALTSALRSLLAEVRTAGRRIPDDELSDSDLILPAADSSVAEVKALLDESSEGLIPN